MIDAVILAGGTSYGLGQDGSLPKSLLPFNGRLMIDYILDALNACPEIGKKVLVGSREVEEKRGKAVDCFLEGGENVFDNLLLGLRTLPKSSRVLIVTSDIPFLSQEALADFLSRCGERKADFYYPVIRKEDNERKYPGNKRTFVKVREGTFTGGNIFLVNPTAVTGNTKLIQRIISLRKKPLMLAGVLGWGFLFKFLLGLLTVKELEDRVSSLFGIQAVSIITPYAEIGVDIDKPSDLDLIKYFN